MSGIGESANVLMQSVWYVPLVKKENIWYVPDRKKAISKTSV